MVITINIPSGFKEDITINIKQTDSLPFSDGLPNEEIILETNKEITETELKEFQESQYNDTLIYLAQNMGGGVAPLGTYSEETEGVIEIG